MKLLHMLKSKLHRAAVTDCDLNYEGSCTLDPQLMKQAQLLPNEWIWVLNVNNGARFETYVIPGTPGSKECVINGAAARLCARGDRVIIAATITMSEEEALTHTPIVLQMNEKNEVTAVTSAPAHAAP